MMRRTVKPGKKRCERRGASRIDTPGRTRTISTYTGEHESIAMAVPLVLGSSGDDDLNELVERLQTLNPETKAQVIALVRMA